MFLPRTDLAMEAAELTDIKDGKTPDGLVCKTKNLDGICVTEVRITNETGEKVIGKPKGRYVTIECRELRDGGNDILEKAKKVFSKELAGIVKDLNHGTILVAGLGNRFVTPDSLGPYVADGIDVNRHLGADGVSLCSISPGVLGITGMETGEIIEGITERIKPDLIIAIDALASRSMDRICTTIQISDTGITPGSGVGNRRKELSIKTLGVPVIAVGVPTVVDAATVANDSLEHILDMMTEDDGKSDFFDDDKRYEIIKEILNPFFGKLIVTPSQIDGVISHIGTVISGGINNLRHNLS